MEETNYHRKPTIHQSVSSSGVESQTGADDIPTEKSEKTATVTGHSIEKVETGDAPQEVYHRKTYADKLKLFEKDAFRKENKIGGMMLRPLIFLTFPVIFYSGFSYGSNLVWFNVLNATASLIYSGKPYNFAPSMVGLSYLSPLLGVIVG